MGQNLEDNVKPYSDKLKLKGISGRRRSADSTHRRRCLRRDKKSARQSAKIICYEVE